MLGRGEVEMVVKAIRVSTVKKMLAFQVRLAMLEDKGLGGKGGGCPGLEVNKKEGQFTQTGPPDDRKKSKCLVILILRRFRGGPV